MVSSLIEINKLAMKIYSSNYTQTSICNPIPDKLWATVFILNMYKTNIKEHFVIVVIEELIKIRSVGKTSSGTEGKDDDNAFMAVL